MQVNHYKLLYLRMLTLWIFVGDLSGRVLLGDLWDVWLMHELCIGFGLRYFTTCSWDCFLITIACRGGIPY